MSDAVPEQADASTPERFPMMTDPWSRPTLKDLQQVLETIEKSEGQNLRESERLDLSVPAEVTTARGNIVPAMTREVSRSGVGLLHRGAIQPGAVTVKMASETREFEYKVLIEWCHPVSNGMFMSGGRFLRKPDSKT